MQSRIKALVFDFDGVLADTEPLYWKAWAVLLAPHGIEFSWEEYCRIGRGVRDEQIPLRIPQLVSNPSALASVRIRMPSRIELVRRWSLEQQLISEATVRMLQTLTGLRLGLVTSSERREVEPTLRAAGAYNYFHEFVFGEDCVHHKPHPAPYLLMRKKLGVESGVVFEDSDAGMESATAAGFEAIRVGSPAELPGLVAQHCNRQS